jgi:hypothetical protein
MAALSMKRGVPGCDIPASDALARASILLNHAHLPIADALELKRRQQRRALTWGQDVADAQMVRDTDKLGIAGHDFQPKRSDETATPTAVQNKAVPINDGGRFPCSG